MLPPLSLDCLVPAKQRVGGSSPHRRATFLLVINKLRVYRFGLLLKRASCLRGVCGPCGSFPSILSAPPRIGLKCINTP